MINATETKKIKRTRRHARVRSRVRGSKEVPRLAVFKSNRYIYAQIIDDITSTTLAEASSLKDKKGTMREKAEKVGASIGAVALEKKIKKVVFDRGGFLYTGHIKALADSARKAGLTF